MPSQNLKQAFRLDFSAILVKTRRLIIDEWTEQGHVASGESIKQIELKLRQSASDFIGEILVPEHMNELDEPQQAPAVGSSGYRQHIEDLFEWSKKPKVLPSLSERARRRFASNVARKQAEEGIPTRGSFRFSKNGRRTGWSKIVAGQIEMTVDDRDAFRNFIQAFVADFGNIKN